jgi:hypothetical protein
VCVPSDTSGSPGGDKCADCVSPGTTADRGSTNCGSENTVRAGEKGLAATGVPEQTISPQTHPSRKGRLFGIEPDGWLVLAVGLFLAFAAVSINWLTYIFGLFTTMVHELGHTAFGWLFGYPSVPSFDFLYGGGVTLQRSRIWLLVAVVVSLFVWYIFKFRHRHILAAVLAATLMLYLAAALTQAHQGLILAMGHGSELLFAGVFFYRAIRSGTAAESWSRVWSRLTYAFISAFIIFDNIRFSYLLVFSPSQRHQYEAGGGFGYQMDFSRLADNYLNVDVTVIAVAFLLCCLATPVLSYLYLAKRDRLLDLAAAVNRDSRTGYNDGSPS